GRILRRPGRSQSPLLPTSEDGPASPRGGAPSTDGLASFVGASGRSGPRTTRPASAGPVPPCPARPPALPPSSPGSALPLFPGFPWAPSSPVPAALAPPAPACTTSSPGGPQAATATSNQQPSIRRLEFLIVVRRLDQFEPPRKTPAGRASCFVD